MSAMCGQLLLKTSVNSHGSSKWDFKTLWVNELPKRRSVLCLISLKSCGSSAEPLGGINLGCSVGEGSFPWSYCGVTGGVQRALYLVAISTSDWTEGTLQVCGTGRFLPSVRNTASGVHQSPLGSLRGQSGFGGCRMSCRCQPGCGEGAQRSQACSCPAVRLGAICRSLQPMPGTLLVVGLRFFFELTDGRGVWEIPFVLQKSRLEKTSCVFLVQSWFYVN